MPPSSQHRLSAPKNTQKKSEPRQAVRFVLARFSNYKKYDKKAHGFNRGRRSIFPEDVALLVRYVDLFCVAVADVLQFTKICIVEAFLSNNDRKESVTFAQILLLFESLYALNSMQSSYYSGT